MTKMIKLGSHTEYQYGNPTADLLEVFENSKPGRNYEVTYTFNEFTSLCPKTGQPDFATVYVEYIPGAYCIETKSLKIYFLAFRQYGSFMETITNKILDDLVKVCHPRYIKITCRFNARGGTFIDVVAEKPKQTPTLSA